MIIIVVIIMYISNYIDKIISMHCILLIVTITIIIIYSLS